MGVKWVRGNPERLTMKIKERGEELRNESIEALALSVAEGGVYVQDNLEAAHTRTGRRRAEESGGLPGRHDSGNMVGSVSYDESSDVPTRAKVVWMRFGWWGVNFEQYFRDQDLGEGNIPAARALPQAYLRARENFRRRMRDVVRGRGVR